MVVNGLQVAGGLLLLSVSAATSLAEERQRGSLDVLMATPLPTRSIVWGKWWGTFRSVPPLLILPSLLTIALSFHTGHLWGVALMAALILAYGAAITSLGPGPGDLDPADGPRRGADRRPLHDHEHRLDSAVLYHLREGPGDDGIGVAAGSPLMGVGIYSSMLAGDGTPSRVRRARRLDDLLDDRLRRRRPRPAAGHARDVQPLPRAHRRSLALR